MSKTPRTEAAERRCHDEDGVHGFVRQSEMEALEIETQELAEALGNLVVEAASQHWVKPSEDFESAMDSALAALARHQTQ